MSKLYCIVTNDLVQDQRMHRICSFFHEENIETTLVGRIKKRSLPLLKLSFCQIRLKCWFEQGIFFYIEFNIRVFCSLVLKNYNILYCADIDTVPAGVLLKWVKNTKLILDLHELYTEVPELEGKPFKKWIWEKIEKIGVANAHHILTVNYSLAKIYNLRYKKTPTVIYNVPNRENYIEPKVPQMQKKYLLYQGVLNKGRALEQMIEAMTYIHHELDLYIVGEGDLSTELRKLSSKSKESSRIYFVGWKTPDELLEYTANAWLGINLLDDKSKNYYYSLANKFFDYMHALVPSINNLFPEYTEIFRKYPMGILISNINPVTIADEINKLYLDPERYTIYKANCNQSIKEYNWENEKDKLRQVFDSLR